MVIRVSDGDIPAHKVILASRYPASTQVCPVAVVLIVLVVAACAYSTLSLVPAPGIMLCVCSDVMSQSVQTSVQ